MFDLLCVIHSGLEFLFGPFKIEVYRYAGGRVAPAFFACGQLANNFFSTTKGELV